MKILFDDKVKHKGTAITNTHVNFNFPPESLADPFLRKDYRSSSTVDRIDFKFQDTITANCVFWSYHNLGELQIILYDKLENEIHSETIARPRQAGAIYFEEKQVKLMKIQVSARSGQVVALLGGVAIGMCVTITDPLSDINLGFTDNSFINESSSGQSLNNYEEPLRTHQFLFKGETLEQGRLINALYKKVGIGGKIWLDAFEETKRIMDVLYCYLQSPPNVIKANDHFEFQLDIKEAR